MQRPAIFFDRDNTLIVNDGYLGDADGVILVPDAPASLARARRMGFAVVVVSNQSGVARGMFTEEDVASVNNRMDLLLQQADRQAIVDRHEYCPFLPGAEATVERYRQDSQLRKPHPGMLLRAARAMDLDLSQSWIIGDAPRDVHAGKAAGCRAILLHPPGPPVLPQADAVVASLTAALDFIAAQ